MINLVMTFVICFNVHCTLIPSERKRCRDLCQMPAILSIGQIGGPIAISLIDLPLVGKFGKEFQTGDMRSTKRDRKAKLCCFWYLNIL